MLVYGRKSRFLNFCVHTHTHVCVHAHMQPCMQLCIPQPIIANCMYITLFLVLGSCVGTLVITPLPQQEAGT